MTQSIDVFESAAKQRTQLILERNNLIFGSESTIAPSHYKLLFKAPDYEGQRLIVVEPFTWAWLGLMLAEGAVQWLGGRILEQQLKDLGLYESDTAKFAEKVFADFRNQLKYIHQEFLDQDARDCAARMKAMENDFQDYKDAPKSNPTSLDKAYSEANLVIAKLMGLDLHGFGNFFIAAGDRIALVQAKYDVTKDKNQKTILSRDVNAFVAHGQDMIQRWTDMQDKRVTIFISGGGLPGHQPARASIRLDGHFLANAGQPFIPHGLEAVERQRQAYVRDTLIPDLNNTYLNNARLIIEKWEEMKRKYNLP